MAEKSVKLSELMATGKKAKRKPMVRSYKEARSACGK